MPTAPASPQAHPLLRPRPPLAKRLNRNALTVGAVVAGLTVLTALVLVRPARGPLGPDDREESGRAPPAADGAPGAPSRPAFLDAPVTHPTPGQGPGGPGGPGPAVPGGGPERTFAATPATPVTSDTTAASDRQARPGGNAGARERSYRAALASAAVLGTAPPAPPEGAADATGRADSTALATEERELLGLGDSVLRASTPGAAGTGGTGSAAPTLLERRHRAFLAAQGDAHGSTVSARLDPAGSPLTLRAGTVIPGFLLTAINSDLPGDVLGQVSRDIYDSRTERLLLIPKGARLIGTYDSHIAAGEGRLLVAWTRLLFPDGRSLKLPGLALKDGSGQTGAQDQVDTHWERAVGKALLLSAIGAAAQLSQPRQASLLAAPSGAQIAAGALGQELSSVATELIRRGLDAPPTITIRAGHAFNVFLNGDLVFAAPYTEDQPARRWTWADP